MPAKYKCLIVDDNMIDRDVLGMHISKIDDLVVEAICVSGLEAVSILQKKPIDIVFSDIDMPDISGIELLQSLKNPPVFIFISSHSEHAAESYNLDVIDFIVKPATLPRIIKSANKAIEYIELKKNPAYLQEIVLPGTNAITTDKGSNINIAEENYFFLKEGYDFSKISYADVLYVESMGNFSCLYTVEQKKHVTLVSLKNIEAQLHSFNFVRVHKQYIINIKHIVSVTPDGTIQLTGGESIPLGIMYKTALMDIINKKTLWR